MELCIIPVFLCLVSTVTVHFSGQTEVLMFIAHSGKSPYGPTYTNGTLLRCGVTQELNCTALDIFAPNPKNPVYDYVGDHVYWTDSHLHAVCRVSSDGTNYEQWISDLNNIGGLAVDPIQRFGYLQANMSLLRFSLETKNITIVHSSEDDRHLAIDVEKRKLFTARSHGIERMDYNGEQRELLVTTEDSWAKFCYYAEGDVLIYSNSDELISLDMKTRNLMVIGSNYYVGDFVVYKKVVYFRKSYSNNMVHRVLTNGTRLPVLNLPDRLSRPFSMAVFRKYDSVSRTSNGNVSCGHCFNNSLCDVTTGACLRGCGPGWQGATCLSACMTGRYGRNCVQRCGQCSGDFSCDPVSGACSGGCRAGWTGRLCDQECPDGSYGEACNSSCGQCKNNAACDKSTGACPNGCNSGWLGKACDQACSDGQYGSDCMMTCGNCYNDQACRKSDGACEGGCDPGWTGNICKSVCRSGRYGWRCASSCGQCKVGTECEKTTGLCPEGCKPGWTGPKCDTVCRGGQYGSNCMMTCGHCYNDRTCRKLDGVCEGGCDPGWTGNICKTACRSGRYGKRCASSCGQCKVGTECEKTTGLCPEGCKPGWTGPKCITACSDGQYGSNCMQTCGHCYKDRVCRKSDGACEGGCGPGWTGNTCKSACRSGRYGKLCASLCGQCKVGTECEKTTGLCPEGCKPGWTGPKCDSEVENVHPKLDVMFGLLGSMMFGLILALFRLWFCRQCSRTRTNKQNIEEIAMVAHSNPEYQVGAGGEGEGTSGADKEDIYENERMILSKLGQEEQEEEAVYETF